MAEAELEATSLIQRLEPHCSVRVRKALRRLGCRKVDRTLDRPSQATHEQVLELAALLERSVQQRDLAAGEQAKALFSSLSVIQVSEIVQVVVQGAPPWLDTSRWEGELPAAQARWVLREIHGLHVAGHRLEVLAHPELRAGRGAQRRGGSGVPEGLDEEARYSFTQPELARAFVRGAAGRVIDGTCGAGGLTLALAARAEVEEVLAVEPDRPRLETARRLAREAGLERKIRFHHGLAEEVLDQPHDLLVLDPPWGGVDYDRRGLGLAELGMDLRPLLETSAGVLLKLPRSFLVQELPGDWRLSGELDERGVLKFLRAERC